MPTPDESEIDPNLLNAVDPFSDVIGPAVEPDGEDDVIGDEILAAGDVPFAEGEVIVPDPEAFHSVDELPYGRRGRPFSHSQVRTYVRRWRVILRPGYQQYGPMAVIQAPGLPWPYSTYVSAFGVEYDMAALLVDYDAEQEDSDDYQRWIVTGTYSTDLGDTGPNFATLYGNAGIGPQNNPELERPVIEWDEEETIEAPQYDLDGMPYVNSAGMPYSPAPTFPVANPVLVIVRNMKTFDPRLVRKYSYAVNSDTFLGNPPETCQCLPPRAKLMYRGPVTYYRVTWRVRIKTQNLMTELGVTRPDTWQPKFLDAGMYRLQTITGYPLPGQTVPIFRHGHAVTQPVPLDGLGQELKPDPVTKKITPVWNNYRRFQRQPLNELFTNLVVP